MTRTRPVSGSHSKDEALGSLPWACTASVSIMNRVMAGLPYKKTCCGAPAQKQTRACVGDDQRAIDVQHRAVVAGKGEREHRGRVTGDADIACGAGVVAVCQALGSCQHVCVPRAHACQGVHDQPKVWPLLKHSAALSTQSSSCMMRTRLRPMKPKMILLLWQHWLALEISLTTLCALLCAKLPGPPFKSLT